MDTENSTYPQSRRSFLVHSAQALVGLTAFSIPEICSAKVASGKRSVYLYHANQRKELKLTYAVGNLYDPRALAQVNSFLRDYHTGQIHRIDPKLLDILWAVQQETGAKGAYKVVSAFRSPQTNRKLSRTHRGVADHSLHMKGRAVDLSHPDVRLSQIRHCAMNMRTGGVGYYPRSNFVHLDTGMYRTW
ncbi:DUF882 domain-containing protein [Desulfobulbus rhabdoformis]|uniref:YcbK family protein n=1 Tax=Desulfobulbus rhabdoformis TaxID=34032 RepID=UPI00196283FD|nr:DUF882 domain-containing protein [Desulfobulbus rhabdoformis]MBM9615570.1 DUF882 domain-containing protein [Desulfobulbus rhabdoformis]